MARELSFSVDRLLHQPSKVVVASSTLGALSLFNCPERICAPPHHPYSVVPAIPLVTVTHLMQQRTSLLATTIPTLWIRLPELGPTEQQNNEEQLPSEREKRNFPCHSVSPCLSSSSKDEEGYEVQEFNGVNCSVQPQQVKNKKSRTTFTSNQLQELERRFNQQKYLTKMDRLALAKSLSLTERHVKTWYQNRRTKWKKDCSEDTWSKEREYAAVNMYRQHLQMKSHKRSLSIEQQTM